MFILVYQAVFTAFRYAQFDGLPTEVFEVAQQYNTLENYLCIRNVPVEYQAPLVHAYMEAVSNVVSLLPSRNNAFSLLVMVCVVHFPCSCWWYYSSNSNPLTQCTPWYRYFSTRSK